ncbi:MAG: Gfo/Idh/MocA family oxidoreductase [Oscillochloris sp.]|nr:Gfo/Idh/MocA family oxidoreductase [Oscillochloris sp.]
MNTLRVGVIGSGYWGPNLIRNFAELPNAEVVAVADLNPERLNNLQARYPDLVLTADYRSLFALDLAAVVVATPPHTHYAITRDCLLHGLHVLVEKPLALNSLESQELIEIARVNGLVLMVGHTFEYNNAVLELRRLIDGGEIGDVYYIDAVRVNLGLFQPKLNAMWDLAPHDISILLYLIGHDVTSVSATGSACVFDSIHDIVYMNLTFGSGVTAHIRVSWLDPNKTRRITVVGSKKMVVYDDVETSEKIKIYDKGVERPPYTETFDDFQCSYRSGNVHIPQINFTEPLRQECQHFVDCIINRQVPRSNGVVGLNVVKILEAADWSLHNGSVQQMVQLLPVPEVGAALLQQPTQQAA